MPSFPPPAPLAPIPSAKQWRWQRLETYAFVHFSLNTYTDQAWGYGDEDLSLFNPQDLDARQWARVCRDAGLKAIIVTAKHHCGFCLWPSAHTDYSVKNSPWKDGKGDVIGELAAACQEYGLKLGIYLSPWDRNRADYAHPSYISYFRQQLTELLTNYGPIFEIWFDGANGGSGYYGGARETRTIDPKTYYDWPNTYRLIRSLQPECIIWNDGGDRGELRWVGTEDGFVGETNWSMLDSQGDVSWDMLHHGLPNGDAWVAAEVNTSIRPEWFYHPSEDGKVKSLPRLLDVYYASVGRNASLLLNFPITPAGLIHPNDEQAALAWAQAIRDSFAHDLAPHAQIAASPVRGGDPAYGGARTVDGDADTYWATDDGVTQGAVTLDWGQPTAINRLVVEEGIRLGQRVSAFEVEGLVGGEWQTLAHGTTIGYRRILRFPSVEVTQVRFSVRAARACPVITKIGVFNAPLVLRPPTIMRNQQGDISFRADDIGPFVHYTLGGSRPTPQSPRFTAPIPTDGGRLEVRAITFDPSTGQVSPVGSETFDLARGAWAILGTDDPASLQLLDGDPATVWHKSNGGALPVDLEIDLGSQQTLVGFRYLPDHALWGPGIITQYEFWVSADRVGWQLVSAGEFANIINNPIRQEKAFAPVKARYIRLRALKNGEGNGNIGYSTFDVITRS